MPANTKYLFKKRIAVVGTVGVPSRYGGFETLADQLVQRIDVRDAELVIYCQRSAYPEYEKTEGTYFGHRRVFIPLAANGSLSLIYDAASIFHAIWVDKSDVVLALGYSGSWVFPFVKALSRRTKLVVNVDGVESRRGKFGRVAKAVLRLLEYFALRFSDTVIADNLGIVTLILNAHGRAPVFIPYGGDHTLLGDVAQVFPRRTTGYFLSIARVEPENNCHMILESFKISGFPLVFVGNWNSSGYGRGLRSQYSNVDNLKLLDPMYDLSALQSLRSGAVGYVHGHSVGGTNPSLVEAIFHTDRIFAYDCVFNRHTLLDAGCYFSDVETLVSLLGDFRDKAIEGEVLEGLRRQYQWDSVIESYRAVLLRVP